MTTRRDDTRFAWALAAATAFLLLVGLERTDLWAPDEPRIAEVAEELRSMRHGAVGLVLLHANGEPYTQKPPLYYWFAAGFGTVVGSVTELAARLPSALAGVGCVALTVAFGRTLFGDARVGLWAAALLLTVFRFAHLARRAQLDILLTLFEGVALLAFFRLESARGNARGNLIALHAALGLAVLTKGPVGLLPLLGIAVYLAWQGRLREMRRLLPLWSPLLSLLPATLWLAGAIALGPAGFFSDAIVDNVFARFLHGSSHARPWFYFGLQYPLDFLPWTLLWPLAIAVVWPRIRSAGDGAAHPDQRALRLLVAWIGVCLVFFSISTGKRGLYLMPIFPATALLCAYAFRERLRVPMARVVYAGIALIAVVLGAGGLFVALHSPVELPNNPGFAIPVAFAVSVAAIALSLLIALGAMVRRGAAGASGLGLAVGCIVLLYAAVFLQAYPAFDGHKSPRPIARAALLHSAPDAPIGIFDQRALVEAVAYYADRPVVHFMEPEEALAFARVPGRVLIVRSSKLDRLRDHGPVVVEASLREGRRELLVVRSAPLLPAAVHADSPGF